MKKLLIILGFVILTIACKNSFSSKNDAVPLDIHEVTVKEFINTNNYTYVLADQSGKDIWMAVPKTEIKVGGVYYYQGGMLMEKFESKELKRIFPSVLFLEGLSDNRDKLLSKVVSPTKNENSDEKMHTNVNASNLNKLNIKIKTAKGGLTIAELYAKKEIYSGKKVKISGQVTKYSPDIMKKNWIHLQDGTENGGKFDLTITTNALVGKGDTVTFEGNIAINKDFGYGYSYEVIMEDAKLLK